MSANDTRWGRVQASILGTINRGGFWEDVGHDSIDALDALRREHEAMARVIDTAKRAHRLCGKGPLTGREGARESAAWLALGRDLAAYDAVKGGRVSDGEREGVA